MPVDQSVPAAATQSAKVPSLTHAAPVVQSVEQRAGLSIGPKFCEGCGSLASLAPPFARSVAPKLNSQQLNSQNSEERWRLLRRQQQNPNWIRDRDHVASSKCGAVRDDLMTLYR